MNRRQRRKKAHAIKVAHFVADYEIKQSQERRKLVITNKKTSPTYEERAWSKVKTSSVAMVQDCSPVGGRRESLFNPKSSQGAKPRFVKETLHAFDRYKTPD